MIEQVYLAICTIRRFEERLIELKRNGLIEGSLHPCCGQEAVAVGACRALSSEDALTVTYRGHGWALAQGVPPADLFAEVMGRESPLSGGRGGSAFFSAKDYGLVGENSIVGAGLPIAVGVALAARFQGGDAVSVASIGDGAMNQGAVHEALNMAGVMHLPLVTIIENNGWAELTPASAMVATDTLVERAEIYGMPGVRVDGNDSDEVQAAVGEAVGRARAGEGPTLIEAMTTRLLGHYDLDQQHYRPEADLAAARDQEPLARLRRQLDEARIAQLEAEVAQLLDEAFEAATRVPIPDLMTAGEHVYG